MLPSGGKEGTIEIVGGKFLRSEGDFIGIMKCLTCLEKYEVYVDGVLFFISDLFL